MTEAATKTNAYNGMDIWYAWMQDMEAADRIFAKLNPFQAKRILLQAAHIGSNRIATGQLGGYFSWLGSLAEIVWEKGNQADCYLAGVQYLCKAKTSEWLEEIAKWRADMIAALPSN